VTITPQKMSVAISADTCANMLDKTIWANEFTWNQLEVLSRYFEPYSIKNGGILFEEGDLGGTMSILTKGKIEIQKNNKALTTLQTSRSFGEMSLIDNGRRSATAIALEDSEFISMDRLNFDKLSKEHSSLALIFILKITQLLSQRLRQTSSQLTELLD